MAKPFEEQIEFVLDASPSVLMTVIKTAAHEFEPQKGLAYTIWEELESSSDSYKKMSVTALEIIEDSVASEDCIGIITLQALNINQTLFRIPPRKHWYISIKPHILPSSMIEGHVTNNEFNLYWDDSYFTKMLERLISEFYRLGFIDLKTEKAPLGFKPPKRSKS